MNSRMPFLFGYTSLLLNFDLYYYYYLDAPHVDDNTVNKQTTNSQILHLVYDCYTKYLFWTQHILFLCYMDNLLD